MEEELKTGLKLGFGLMRLPKNADGSSSVEETSAMVDRFIQAGGTYFDTAFAYGDSEITIRKALVERYPRSSYTLTSKLFVYDGKLGEKNAKQEIYESLDRTGAGYFDLYLLHAFQRSNYHFYEEWGLWDYVKDLKAKGLIRHFGFSFHADPEFLEEILDAHPDTEFVQLQLNYADWENPGVNSKRNLEICISRNIPVIVMEPVKGGILADPIPEVKDILTKSKPDASFSSWAIRFAASQKNIFTVLSGMSNISQMEDNLSFMKDFKPLNEEEIRTLEDARHVLDSDRSIPCTACHYCSKGCPMSIPIPEIFTVENRKKGSPAFRTVREYTIVTAGKGKADDCIQCGQCEAVCPQHLPVMELLKRCSWLSQNV